MMSPTSGMPQLEPVEGDLARSGCGCQTHEATRRPPTRHGEDRLPVATAEQRRSPIKTCVINGRSVPKSFRNPLNFGMMKNTISDDQAERQHEQDRRVDQRRDDLAADRQHAARVGDEALEHGGQLARALARGQARGVQLAGTARPARRTRPTAPRRP